METPGDLNSGEVVCPPPHLARHPSPVHTRTRTHTFVSKVIHEVPDVLFYYMPACPRTRSDLYCCLHDRWCSVRPQEDTIQFSFERHVRIYLFISPFFPPTLFAQGGERRENLKEWKSSAAALGFWFFLLLFCFCFESHP